MIMAMLVAYFLGGLSAIDGGMLSSSGLKEMSLRSQIVIADPERAEAAHDLLRGLKKKIGAFERAFAREGRELNRLYRNHESNEDQAFTILRQANAEWEVIQRQALDVRFRLRDQMTEEEWARFVAGS